MTLFVPVITDEDDMITAALKYAAAGWYVLPVSPTARKNPGSVVGKGWQHQSSRDPHTIAAWFAGTDDLIALHVGRSGAVVPDVDHPDEVPDALLRAIKEECAPYQSSRPDQHGRGHYVFAQPPGRMIGNSTGKLGKGWGEVRGKNGVIIAAPSRHKDEASGARYEWLQTGEVPELPDYLAELLPDATDTVDAATDAEVARFVAAHTSATSSGKLRGPLTKYGQHLAQGASRHESMTSVAAWAMREVMAGLYTAEEAVTALRKAFTEAMASSRAVVTGRDGKEERTLPATTAQAEVDGILAWAIAQAEFEVPVNGTQNPQNPVDGSAGEVSEGFEGVSRAEWDPPTPLPGRTDPLPVNALGAVLGPLVDAVGVALQVPTDLAVNLALPIITTAAGGGWIVEVQSGWTEPLCLDTLSALPSGERKSPTLKVLGAPLHRFEKAAQQEARPERARKLAERKLAEDRVTEARKVAVKKSPGGAEERRYLDAVAHLETIEVPPLPRWQADDATPEAVVGLLAEHRSIGIISAEPGLFGVLAGRYSNGTPNIEWFLAATSGEPIKVDRMSRDAQDVADPALSMASCIQPGRLVELGSVKAFRDSGLLARLLFALPTSDVGNRGPTTAVPAHLLESWDQHITALAIAGHKRRDSPDILRVDDDGRRALEELRAAIEPHLHPDHGHYAGIADWMNKLPGTIVRIAAAITLLHDPDAQEITGATLRNAVRIGRAYVSHARAAFGLTRPNGEVASRAKQVLATVVKLCAEERTTMVRRRDVHQKLRDRAWVESAASLDTPIELLVEYGHLRTVEVGKGTPGRPSPQLELHPEHLAEEHPQNDQNLAAPERTP